MVENDQKFLSPKIGLFTIFYDSLSEYGQARNRQGVYTRHEGIGPDRGPYSLLLFWLKGMCIHCIIVLMHPNLDYILPLYIACRLKICHTLNKIYSLISDRIVY